MPHAAFTDFWNAASTTDSALRNVTLKIDDAMMELVITDVVLLEGTPIHPVVAEMRLMWRPLRLFLIGLIGAAGAFVALEIVRVAWMLWHGGSAGGTDQVTLWIEETPQTQVAIGSITTDEEHREPPSFIPPRSLLRIGPLNLIIRRTVRPLVSV